MHWHSKSDIWWQSWNGKSEALSRSCPSNVLQDILGDNSLNRASFKNLNLPFFLLMVHRCKKCSDISEVTYGGRAEIEKVKNDRASDLPFQLCHHSPLLKIFNVIEFFKSMDRISLSQIFKWWFISWITYKEVADFVVLCLIHSTYP